MEPRPKVEAKIIKLLKENIRENLLEFGLYEYCKTKII